MSAKQRMNLFHEMAGAGGAKPAAAKPFKLGLHGKVAVGISVLLVVGMIRTQMSYTSGKAAIREKVRAAEAELERLVLATEEAAKAKRARETATMAKRDPAVLSTKPLSAVPLDATWSSLLWRFSSLTGTGVLIERIELKGATGTAGKTMTLAGLAKSLPAMRDWVDRLLTQMPGWDFVMDSQGGGGDGNYPVAFRVSARTL